MCTHTGLPLRRPTDTAELHRYLRTNEKKTLFAHNESARIRFPLLEEAKGKGPKAKPKRAKIKTSAMKASTV